MSSETDWFWDRIGERAIETIKALRNNEVPPICRFAVHITGKCNMRCKYCKDPKNNVVMSRQLFDDICNKAGSIGTVHITGGEPMCVKWLPDAILQHPNVRFALNSNALVIPSVEVLRRLWRYKTSLDDYDEDRWNELVGGKFFLRVVNNIKIVTKEVKYTSVSFTATHNNASRFSKFIDFCNKEFPDLYSISVSFFKGIGENVLSQDDIDNLFKDATKLNKVSQQVFFETHSTKGNYFPENLQVPCYLAMSERLIDEYGREFYCSHLFRDHVIPPGNPGKDPNCVTGCNARFHKFNQLVHKDLQKQITTDNIIHIKESLKK